MFIIVQLFLNIIFPLLIFPATSLIAENRWPSSGCVLTMLNNRSQNVTISSLFPCYAGDIFLRMPIDLVLLFHQHKPWRTFVFKILNFFCFWPFFMKITWALHELGGLCLHKFISPEYFCCLRFQLIYIFP